VALRRTCEAWLEQNRYLRKQATRIGKRQMAIIESLAFNWVPLVLDNACLRSMSELELVLTPRGSVVSKQSVTRSV
jgi:hypothetical protein